MTERAHVIVNVHCTHCRSVVELECEGVPPYPGYLTFNEFTCPICHKLNRPQTPGGIVAAREAA